MSFSSRQKVMSNFKLLALSKLVGIAPLLCCASSALAQSKTSVGSVVNFGYTMIASCTITSTTNGSLVAQQTPTTQLWGKGNDRAKVVVFCNQSGKRLELSINDAASNYYNGRPRARLSAGGDASGNFNVNTGYATINNGIYRDILTTTDALGDIARIDGEINALNAPTGVLLQAANDYKLVVNVSITP
jgi:hypothetical protein